MNTFKLLHLWNNEFAIVINGKNFYVHSEITGYTKNCNARYRYFVEISPDYNPTGKIKIYGKNNQELINKLAKLDYTISIVGK